MVFYLNQTKKYIHKLQLSLCTCKLCLHWYLFCLWVLSLSGFLTHLQTPLSPFKDSKVWRILGTQSHSKAFFATPSVKRDIRLLCYFPRTRDTCYLAFGCEDLSQPVLEVFGLSTMTGYRTPIPRIRIRVQRLPLLGKRFNSCIQSGRFIRSGI